MNPFITSTDTTVNIVAVGISIGPKLTSLKIIENGSIVKETSTDTIIYSVSLFTPGRKNYLVIVEDSLGQTDTASFHLVYNNPVVDRGRPPEITDGINYPTDHSSVTLSLFAPYKQYVYVLGDFNDWEVDPEYFMNRDMVNNDSVHYWITLSGLSPGKEYAFQYLVDGDIRIADPYTDKILDRWNDSGIPGQVYPNLKPYPTGKTEFAVSVLETGQTPYDWQSTAFQRPEKKDLIIYEMLVRDFVGTHSYKTLVDTLDYLKRLGVNAIELMPINEFEGNGGWGYNPSFYFAPDKYYGTRNDLKAFIDACHLNGMAVIMDIVLNHSYGQSPFVRLYYDSGKPSTENPWYNRVINFANPDANWGFDFDHESSATQTLVDRINSYWLSEYRFDGFRFDFTKGFGNNYKPLSDLWGSKYDGDRIRLLKRMADTIWKDFPNTYIIMEHLAEEKEEIELANYGILMWANANYNFNEATMGYHNNGKSNISWTYYKNRGWTVPNMITYMESHDEERLMFKNLEYGNGSGTYSVKNLSSALERMKTAGAFLFLVPGPKMIWQFGELGYDVSINKGGRLGEKPPRWYYRDQPERKKLYDTWSALIALRKKYPVFNSTETHLETWLGSSVKLIKYTHVEMNAFLVGNFAVKAQKVELDLHKAGTWYHVFKGDSIFFENNKPSIELRPGTFILLTDKPVDIPKADITLLDIADENIQPYGFRLYANYPNPFNPSTTIRFSIKERSPSTTLKVFDLSGRLVDTLVDENLGAGVYTVKWNGAQQVSGVYFIRLQSGSETRTQKVLLVK